jgi:hypothetical protein
MPSSLCLTRLPSPTRTTRTSSSTAGSSSKTRAVGGGCGGGCGLVAGTGADQTASGETVTALVEARAQCRECGVVVGSGVRIELDSTDAPADTDWEIVEHHTDDGASLLSLQPSKVRMFFFFKSITRVLFPGYCCLIPSSTS